MAFSGCTGLTRIDIPNTVGRIYFGAFSGCSNLTAVSIPNSVIQINFDSDYYYNNIIYQGTFENCSKLTSVTVDIAEPREIIEETFTNRTNATLYVPKGCKSKYQAADYWKEFKNIVEISPYIEFADAKVKELSVANWDTDHDGELSKAEAAAVTSLGTVFKKSQITSFDELQYFIGLIGIGKDAFNASTLTSVTLPENITSLEENAFLDCKSLVSIALPAKVQTIGLNALSGCTAMVNITVDGQNESLCSVDGVLFSKDKKTLIQYPAARSTAYTVPEGTTTIARDAFYMSNLESIQLPSTLTELAYDAFGYCKKLTELTIPEGVTTIGEYILDHCSALTTLTIPGTVTAIGQRMANYCTAITDVYTYIQEPFDINANCFHTKAYANATLYVPYGKKNAYANATGWKEFTNILENAGIIDFADTKVKELCVANWDTDHDGELSMAEAAAVTSLGTVFKKSQITSFDELQYFTGLTGIGKDAFNASTLTSVTLPENITALEENAFLDCKSLVSITLPAKVQTIGLNALSGCTAMVDITVDGQNESLCSVDGVLFSKDRTVLIQYPAALGTAYTVPEGTTTIARDAFYMSNLELIQLPSTLTELAYDAFGYCKKLTELTIPEGVTTIGEYILDHCTALTTLTIPGTVTAIGQRMANYCTAITDVYTYIQEPFGINANCFHTKAYASATLHVPYGTGSAYASATGWKEFGKVVNMEDTSPAYAVLSADRKTLTFYNDGDREGKDGTVFSIGNGDNTPEWYEQRAAVTKVVFDASFATAHPKSTHSWFEGMAKLTAFEGMEYLNTDDAVNMSRTFLGCTSLKRVDLGNLDISNATDISEMFSGCTAMASLDLGGFGLQDGTATDNLLLNCKGLKTLKLSASMSGIAAGACQGVGTSTSPCILFVPLGFNFGVNPTGTFQWKSGYFRTADEPVVYAKDTDFYSGQTKNVAICLDNGEEQYSSYQFDLTLPGGFTFETNASGKIVYELSSRYTGSVSVSTTMLEGNTCRVTAYMASSGYISGTDGAIISIGVKADDTLPLGSWEANLSNVFVGMPNDVSVKCSDTSFNLVIGSEMGYIPGDVNHDGYVNMSDVTSIISYILNKAPSPFYMNEADVNADGWVNISDVTAIINIILHKVTANAPENARNATIDDVYMQETDNGYDICLDNTTSYTACEMTLRLPEGCSLSNVWMDNSRSDSHHVLIGNLGDGIYRLAVYSENNNAFSDGEPPMLHLTINGTLGDNVCLSNILFIDDQHACVAFPEVSGVTGIDGVDAGSDNTPTYNLQGIPTQKNYRGVHVRKGRKYVVR